MKKQAIAKPNPTSVQQLNAKILTHDRTEAEEKLQILLLHFLDQIGYSGEVHCRAFIFSSCGRHRRPDFYLPRYGLAIEVDGNTGAARSRYTFLTRLRNTA